MNFFFRASNVMGSFAYLMPEYEADNPKIKTNCEHDFHLSCILEWMERSDGCPICDKVCFLSSFPLVDFLICK